MPRLPIVSYRTMERLLLRLGFRIVRQHGSHVFFRHPDGRTTTVPYHSGRDLTRPLIREILEDINLTTERFVDELKRL